MADIFISYAQADRGWVEKLARLIEQEGFSVWWDIKVLPGDEFGDLVTREIATSKCVVVVWSQHSVQSDWVYGEADEARRKKKLVPVIKDNVQPPTAFRKVHAADFSRWEPQPNSAEFSTLLEAIRARVRHAIDAAEAPTDRTEVEPPPQRLETDPRLRVQAPAGAGSLKAAISGALAWASHPSKVTLRTISVAAVIPIVIAHISWFSAPLWTFWNVYWLASEWAAIGLFAVLAFSQRTVLPNVVRAFMALTALNHAMSLAQLFISIDSPPPVLGLYALAYLANLIVFGAIALKFSEPIVRRLQLFALIGIACFALLEIWNSSVSSGASAVVWLFTLLALRALEVIFVCIAPAQFQPEK